MTRAQPSRIRLSVLSLFFAFISRQSLTTVGMSAFVAMALQRHLEAERPRLRTRQEQDQLACPYFTSASFFVCTKSPACIR